MSNSVEQPKKQVQAASLTEFLLARIAEDLGNADDVHADDCDVAIGFPCNCPWPIRVLAESEAKRRIVELHQDFGAFGDCYHGYMGADSPCPTLRALALPYADHPDYDESWRP